MSGFSQYWYFLIGGATDETSGLVTNFYSYGEHCGEALANALLAATEELAIIKPEATEARRLDGLIDFEEPDGLIQLNDQVFSGPQTYSYPLETESDFIPPTGIIKSTEEGDNYDLIKNAFTALKNSDSENFELELVADKTRLIDTFLQIINLIPSFETFEVHIKGHWHNENTEIWNITLENIHNSIKIFLLENQYNLLENGFIECIIIADNGKTKLILDEHKKIHFYTAERTLFDKLGHFVIGLGFDQTTDLHSLEYNFYHYHYRPVQSLDAPELRLLLLDAGFNCIKNWKEEV